MCSVPCMAEVYRPTPEALAFPSLFLYGTTFTLYLNLQQVLHAWPRSSDQHQRPWHSLFYFFLWHDFFYGSTCKRCYPQLSSGHAAVTGAFSNSPPPRYMPPFLSRILVGFIIPAFQVFITVVDLHRISCYSGNSRSHGFPAVNFHARKKVPASTKARTR